MVSWKGSEMESISSDAISVALHFLAYVFAGICVFSEKSVCWSTHGHYDRDWNMSEL